MTTAHRDLATPEFWNRSLERSRRRRELLPKGRRESNRRKHLSAALATAVVAGPAAPVAAAQVSGDVSAAVAAESPANRAIEIREGGLPLQVGSQGELVAHVQQALEVSADGIFGPETDAAVRGYQASAGLEVDGIVGLATWGALFEQNTASGAAVGAANVPPEVRRQVEQRLETVGQDLAADGQIDGDAGLGAPAPGDTGAAPDVTAQGPTASPAPPAAQSPTTTPAPTNGEACGSSTIANPVQGHGHVELRPALGTQPRRNRHRGPHRHGRPRGGVRDGEPRGIAERLREHGLHHAHEPVLDLLRAPFALRCDQWSAGEAGSGDRLRRLHRQLHRTAPALRDSRRRPGAGSARISGRRLDPGQGEHRRREQDGREDELDRSAGDGDGRRRARPPAPRRSAARTCSSREPRRPPRPRPRRRCPRRCRDVAPESRSRRRSR